MADYYTPTVVQQSLPLADMTALEKLVLEDVFNTEELETEENGPALYCFGSENVNDFPSLNVGELRDALERSAAIPSRLHDLIKPQADSIAAGQSAFDLDLSAEGFEFILQDILRRSKTLKHISVTAAFTCSKMRPDGFGGMVTLITADKIIGESTNGLLEKWLTDAFP
jgi:hypothetical protein